MYEYMVGVMESCRDHHPSPWLYLPCIIKRTNKIPRAINETKILRA